MGAERAVAVHHDTDRDPIAAPSGTKSRVAAPNRDEIAEAQGLQTMPPTGRRVEQLDVHIAPKRVVLAEAGTDHGCRDDVRDRRL